jgi:hypothetical protein
MKTSLFSLALRALLPATVLLASCGKDDEPAAPAPDKSRVMLVHDAANLSTFPIKLTVGSGDAGPSVNYGANSGYQSAATGVLEIKPSIAASGGAQLTTDIKTLGKDKSYSYFVFSGVSQPANTALGVWTEDDLSVPASGAKVRLVHVGQGLVSPLGLSKPNSGGTLTAVISPVGSGTASDFVTIPVGTASYNLVNANNNTIVPLAGASVLATNFVAGKIYTIVIRGSSAPATTNEQFTLDLITNN